MKTIHHILHRARTSTSQTPTRRSNTLAPVQTPAQLSSSASSASSSSSTSCENISIKNTVQVVCRLRPRLPSESPADRSVVQVLNETEIRITGLSHLKTRLFKLVLRQPLLPDQPRADPLKNLVNRFDFSACYDEQSTQEDIYDAQVHKLVTKIFDGITATIFAFGCTGSGKTYTLQGSPSDPGITPKAIRTIFEHVEALQSNPSKPSGSFEITISCFEIWKDKVWDLLAEGGTASTRDIGRGDLPIRETANGQIVIPNLRRVPITDTNQFDRLYAQLMRTRSVSTTKLNHASSRSHALLTIYLNQKTPQGTVRQGRCVLVDLAGSENNKKTGNETNKERMKESVEINQSLLALRKVVRSLNTGDHRIPYRDSKLTRILSDCLGGTSAALVICNVAPGASQYRDTMNTLTFGSHTRNVENKVAPKWPDRHNPSSVSFYQQPQSKSTPDLPSKPTSILASASATTTPPRTPLKINWSLRPTADVLIKPKPSLLPISPKIEISRPMNSKRRNETSQALTTSTSTSSIRQPQITKTVRFRASYSNLLDESTKHRKTLERCRTASERPTAGYINKQNLDIRDFEKQELDKRVEEVMRKTLDQLVQNRVDVLLKARLRENGLTPSTGNTPRDSVTSSEIVDGAQGNTKNDYDDKLSERIATLEQQFVSISNLLQTVSSSARPKSTTSRIPGPKLT